MTCIVGIVSNGTVTIAGDSAASDKKSVTIRADSKVFINDGFLIGFTSSFRMGQLLRYKFIPPNRPKDPALLERYMVSDFIDAVRTCLKDGGYASKVNDEEIGGIFLVGVDGRLFKIESDYQVSEMADRYDACGSGQSVALGSLFSTVGQPVDARIKTALDAASKFSIGVSAPYLSLSI